MSNARGNGAGRSMTGNGNAPQGDLPSGHDPALGQVVAGKYAIESVVGIGGFGTVYRAIQQPVGRPVALKVVHPRHAHDPQLRARFFREAKLVAKLRDRVVVTLHDYGESPEVGLYMAFELIEGATLAKVLKEGPQPTERVANILLQLLRALAEAHGLGMIHRDLKPGNIMLVEDPGSPLGEGVRLLDFGIAKLKVEMAGQDPSLATQQGLFMGTPSYISPEQARASGEVDGRSDLYSLGVVGYALLAGKNPFVGTSVVETILAHCNTAPPPLEDTLQVPAQMEGALRKALEKSPEDRFASAMQMAAAIEAAVPSLVSGVFMRSWAEVPEPLTPSAGAAVQAIPETAQSETWSQALPFVDPQRPLRWALLLILLLVSVGLAGLWFANTGEDSYPREPTTAAMPPQPPPSAEAAALEPTTPAIEEAPEPADVEVSSAPADPAPSELPAKLEAPSEATPERSEQTRPVRPRRRERSAEPRRPAPEESEPTLVIPEF